MTAIADNPRYKTFEKKFLEAAASGNADTAGAALKEATRESPRADSKVPSKVGRLARQTVDLKAAMMEGSMEWSMELQMVDLMDQPHTHDQHCRDRSDKHDLGPNWSNTLEN